MVAGEYSERKWHENGAVCFQHKQARSSAAYALLQGAVELVVRGVRNKQQIAVRQQMPVYYTAPRRNVTPAAAPVLRHYLTPDAPTPAEGENNVTPTKFLRYYIMEE